MDIPPPASARDVLALPLRAQLFRELAAFCRPATTQELAAAAGRHHNTVRVQLQRIAAAGLVERRVTRQTRGRPRDQWAIAPDAAPGGQPPEAHGQLSRWLARAVTGPGDLQSIEAAGREIGRELAAEPDGRPPDESMRDTLTALGYAPRHEAAPDRLRFVLGNCPYREAVLQNQPAICSLQRGITVGLLDRLAPRARLTEFTPRHPYTAGCVIEVAA
jgi:predicted ArsR family transcriptional regulator